MATETPTYPQYTNLALHDGLFDQLMAAVKHHIEFEWTDQRIRGDVYAKTYLGAMESVLANTTQYLIAILLIDERRDKLLADTELVIQQTKLTKVETDKAQFELDVLMPLQADKIRQEILVMQAQVLQILAEIDKIRKEIEYIIAKIATEIANVDATDVLFDSVIGRQMELLRAQKLGFAGDIQTKTAKLHADYAAVYQSVQENPDEAALNFDVKTAIAYALQTAEKIKDPAFVDPPDDTAPPA